jgi:site-specific DNA-adenine methylase
MIQHPLLTLKDIRKSINKGIFDNSQENEIHNEDVFDFLKHIKGDVIYFDPPYPESSAYEDEYYILDCILAGKKIEKDKSVFSKADAKVFIEKMLECSKHIPQWIISLGQTKADVGIKPDEMLEMVKKHRKAELQILDHKWSVANAGGRPQNDNIEYIVTTL